MSKKEEKTYEGGQLPELQITTTKQSLPFIHYDTFGNVYSINRFGQRIQHDARTFDPTGMTNLSAEDFENARLHQAQIADINHTHQFGDQIRNFALGLVTGTGAEDVVLGPLIGKGMQFIGNKVSRPLKKIIKTLRPNTKITKFATQFDLPTSLTREIEYSDDYIKDLVKDAHKHLIKEYKTNPEKINQIKQVLGWNDSQYDEFLEEMNKIFKSKDEMKIDPGMKARGKMHTKVIPEEPGIKHRLILNNKHPSKSDLVATVLHEFNHARTVNYRPLKLSEHNTIVKQNFPRIVELVEANSKIADQTLELNKLGKFMNQFQGPGSFQAYFEQDKLNNKRPFELLSEFLDFEYSTDLQEKIARASATQLLDKYNIKSHKQLNPLLKYYTPESVEKFKTSVLGIAPIIGINLTKENE